MSLKHDSGALYTSLVSKWEWVMCFGAVLIYVRQPKRALKTFSGYFPCIIRPNAVWHLLFMRYKSVLCDFYLRFSRANGRWRLRCAVWFACSPYYTHLSHRRFQAYLLYRVSYFVLFFFFFLLLLDFIFVMYRYNIFTYIAFVGEQCSGYKTL